MEDYRFLYLSAWIAFLVFSVGIVTKNWNHFKTDSRKYWPYLTTKWKLVTFAVSGAFISFAGPFTSDPTWDFISGFGMSVLTYLTAPWCVGVIYQFIKRQRALSDVIVAITFWLLSASWFYDGYIWWRDGFYPPTWNSNLLVSSALYFCAGLFWNLESVAKQVGFGFERRDWPTRFQNDCFGFFKIYVLLFIIVVSCILFFSTTWHL